MRTWATNMGDEKGRGLMVVEMLYEDYPWPIGLPQEPPTYRPLVARREATGEEIARWDGTQDDCGRWMVLKFLPGTARKWWRWHEIVGVCMDRGWSLYSFPREGED